VSSPTTAPVRAATAVVGLQLALFIALGLPDGALGVAWKEMRGSLDRPLGNLGYLLAVSTVGYLLGSTNLARVIRAWGTSLAVLIASAVATVAIGVWAAAGVWALVLACSFFLGLSRGITDGALNAYVALHGGVRQLGLLHGCYGIGTTIAPLLVVSGEDAFHSWRPAWTALAVIQAAMTVWAFGLRDRWPPDITPVPLDDDGDEGATPWTRIILTVLTFAALVGAEFSTGAWSYTLLTDGRGMGATAAGIAVATFWGGLTAGRFGMAWVGHLVRRTSLLRGSCLVALAGVAFLAWNPGGAGFAGLPLAGLGMAAIFPTLVALTPDRLGPHRSTAVIGWSIAAASLGGTAVAALAGRLADVHGADILGPTLLVSTTMVVALEIGLGRVAPVTAP
jgi:fucose permease